MENISVADFFAAESTPAWLEGAQTRLDAFVADHGCRIACVTSGGTTVPLERNTVRFIDNFSTGNRGAAVCEEVAATASSADGGGAATDLGSALAAREVQVELEKIGRRREGGALPK